MINHQNRKLKMWCFEKEKKKGGAAAADKVRMLSWCFQVTVLLGCEEGKSS